MSWPHSRGSETAAAEEARVFGNEHVRLPVDLWETLGEVGSSSPVRGGAAAIEETGFSEISRTHTNAGDVSAPRIVMLKPGEEFAVFQQLLIERQP